MLTIYAGKSARETLNEQGFSSETFSTFLGASGGPKWFSLYGLDRYMFGEFFKGRKTPLNLVGSSAGAFRAACFAQADPVDAIERLAKDYSETTYSDKVDAAEITASARILLDALLGETGADEIINNPIFRAHFIVARVNGLAASEQRWKQLVGLTKSYISNRIDRKNIVSQYERVVYQNPDSKLAIEDESGFVTEHISLSKDNLKDALLASGSIPMVMQGIADIADSKPGMYRDGGIIDYHFDIQLLDESIQSGLTLYPHFNHSPRAGWFDKSLKRKVNARNYDNVVMLVPSAEFVSELPYKKIPDREDFTKMEAPQRIKYWKTVLSETEKLADYFAKIVEDKSLPIILPIDAK
jgi:hypothetical protein